MIALAVVSGISSYSISYYFSRANGSAACDLLRTIISSTNCTYVANTNSRIIIATYSRALASKHVKIFAFQRTNRILYAKSI